MWIEVADFVEDTLIQAYDSLSAILDNIQVYGEPSKKEEDPFSIFLKVFAFVLPFLIALFYFSYKYSKVWKWIKGHFPAVPYSIDNLSQAHISLTVSIISCDKYGQMKKLSFLRAYVRKYRPLGTELFEDLVDRNFHYPMHTKSVCEWLKKNASKQQNIDFVYFMLGVAHLERGMNAREYKLLLLLAHHLGVEPSLIDQYIKQHVANQEQTHENQNARPVSSKRSQYLEILHLDEGASLDEVKTQYRTLAKKFHPDRFANDSTEKQEQAHQRFLEIQEAYEYLIK